MATDRGFDAIELGDALEGFAGDRSGAGLSELVEAPPHMRPAQGQANLAAFGQHLVAAVAVDLEAAAEAGEMSDRPFRFAVGSIDIDDAGWIGAAPGPVITGISPELARLRPAAAGIEHGRPGFVGEQLGRALQLRQHPFMHGPQQEGGAPDPVGQRRAIERDALARIDLGLTIQRQMIGIFRDQHLGDRRLGRDPVLDQPSRGRSLHHDVLAGPAGIFRPAQHEHTELGRHDVGRSATSSPMRWSLPEQQGQVSLSMSTIISIRRRCGGSAPRFARRWRARVAFSAGAVSSDAANAAASTCSASSNPSRS